VSPTRGWRPSWRACSPSAVRPRWSSAATTDSTSSPPPPPRGCGWRDGAVREESFDPRDVGIEIAPIEALRGGDPSYNAEVVRRLLTGERGPVRDAVLLNAAAALVALEPGEGPLAAQIGAAMARAAESIDSGAARGVLERWVAASNA
jgi:anthranilate phosphoribosyltransferase